MVNTFKLKSNFYYLSVWKETWFLQGSEIQNFNLLKPTGYVMHQQVYNSRILHSAHTPFICFEFISEKNREFCPTRITPTDWFL